MCVCVYIYIHTYTPSSIGLLLTNLLRYFQNSVIKEIGTSNFHKLMVIFFKKNLQKTKLKYHSIQ